MECTSVQALNDRFGREVVTVLLVQNCHSSGMDGMRRIEMRIWAKNRAKLQAV